MTIKRWVMSKNDVLEVSGKVLEALSHAMYRVKLETGQTILAHLAGKMHNHYLKIVAGDVVTIEISPYDLKLGRITSRLDHKAA